MITIIVIIIVVIIIIIIIIITIVVIVIVIIIITIVVIVIVIIAAAAFDLRTMSAYDYDNLKHLHNVETRFYCPQAFLSLDFQCRDDVSELK